MTGPSGTVVANTWRSKNLAVCGPVRSHAWRFVYPSWRNTRIIELSL
jgi:hypothetical protein